MCVWDVNISWLFFSSSKFSIICESHMVPAKKKLIFLLRLAYCPTSQVMFAGPTLMFLVKKTRYNKLFVDLTLKRINFFFLSLVCVYIYIYIYLQYPQQTKKRKKLGKLFLNKLTKIKV